LIESQGVPHTEVDLVLVNGASVDFGYGLSDGDRVSVFPVFESLNVESATRVRSRPLRVTRFAADVHLGRLARYLRLGGFDTLYRDDWEDAQLAETAVAEGRVILTCDRGLLKRSVVTHGYLVRNKAPRLQIAEVLERFDLWSALEPLSRCTVCNGEVQAVERQRVLDRVPAGTAESFEDFWECTECGRVYWQGAHVRSILALFGDGGAGRIGQAPADEEGNAQ